MLFENEGSLEIATGSRSGFEAMNRAVAQHKLEPIVEQSFPLASAAEALSTMEQGSHFGKVGIRIAA